MFSINCQPQSLNGNIPTGKEDSELLLSFLTATERGYMVAKFFCSLVRLGFYALIINLVSRAATCIPKQFLLPQAVVNEVTLGSRCRNLCHVSTQLNCSAGSPVSDILEWFNGTGWWESCEIPTPSLSINLLN